jgi:hypothetical protein
MDHFRFQEEDREKVLVEADVDLTDFFVRTDLRVYAPSAPFRAISPDSLERVSDAHPVDAQGPSNYQLEINLKADGLQPRPERLQLGHEHAASHTATCSSVPGRVRLAYRFLQPFKIVPTEARDAFLAFCADYLQSNRKLFVLQRSEP